MSPILSSLLFLTLSSSPGSEALGPPVAVDDAYATPLDDNLSVDAPGVLENDSDPDGDALTAVLVSSAGASGQLFLEPDGSFEYEPGALGTDVFTYQASDGGSLSNVATITFTVTPASTALAYTSEAAFHGDLVLSGFQRFQESFEDESVWGPSRDVAVPSITSQGITWTSNYAVNGIRTGPGPATAGSFGFFSLPHGDYLAGPQCLTPGACTDGWRGTSAQPLIAIGGEVHGFFGSKVEIILDDDPARTFDVGFVSYEGYVGVIDPAGFHTFEFHELEGTSEDAKYIFADHFTFAYAGVMQSGPRVFGCGPNPIGSMRVLAGDGAIGTTLELGLDNPLGTQSPGAATTLILSTTNLGFPCGVVGRRLGMDWDGAVGEILVSVIQANRLATLIGPAWSGSGVPASVPVPIPNDAQLIGLTFYAQGALIDPLAPAGYRLGLTEAVEVVMSP